jgi:hypothetical protein
MGRIEPNVATLPWFAIFALVATAGFYLPADVSRLATRPDLRRIPLPETRTDSISGFARIS